MSSRILSLPPEMLDKVVSFLDIPDLVSLRLTCSDFKQIVDAAQVWKRLAEEIGADLKGRVTNWQALVKEEILLVRKIAAYFLLPSDAMTSARLYDVIRLKFLLEKIKYDNFYQQSWDPPLSKLPLFIKNALLCDAPSMAEVNILRDWMRARDTLVFWHSLAQGIMISCPEADLRVLDDSEEYRKVEPAFKSWFLENIDRLKKLKRLELYKKLISSLPEELWELESLTFLSLGYNQLSFISEKIAGLKKLKRLFIYNNQLIDLPAEVANLRSLVECNLLNNKFLKDFKFKQIFIRNGVKFYI